MSGQPALAAGIDVGSVSTKAVLVRRLLLGPSATTPPAAVEVVYEYFAPTGSSPPQAAARAWEAIRAKASEMGLGIDAPGRVAGDGAEVPLPVVVTGYGRLTAPFPARQVTEITCQAAGIHHLHPDATLVVDVGGQDAKAIRLGPGGAVADFVMNDRCAAGTGRFLEVMARALEVSLDEFGRLALAAPRAAQISSTCTVFAESEVVSRLAEGIPRDEVARGLARAIARRIHGLVGRLGPVGAGPPTARSGAGAGAMPGGRGTEAAATGTPVPVFTGGVAKNPAVVREFTDLVRAQAKGLLPVSLVVPAHPVSTAALGAALLALAAASHGRGERGR